MPSLVLPWLPNSQSQSVKQSNWSPSHQFILHILPHTTPSAPFLKGSSTPTIPLHPHWGLGSYVHVYPPLTEVQVHSHSLLPPFKSCTKTQERCQIGKGLCFALITSWRNIPKEWCCPSGDLSLSVSLGEYLQLHCWDKAWSGGDTIA